MLVYDFGGRILGMMKWRVYRLKRPVFIDHWWAAECNNVSWYFQDWLGAYHWANGWSMIDK